MDSPYLERGESIILTTDRVSVNSLQYDLLLTTKYLILIDIRYARFPPEKIPLQEILSVRAGKIATGDLAITLYFSDTRRTGGSDQMNLIFSRQPGEQRDRERDEWLKKLVQLVVAGRQEAIGPDAVPIDQEIGIRPAKRRQIAPEMQLPHSTVIYSRPVPIELAIIHDEPEKPASEAGGAEPPGEELPGTSPEVPASPEKVTLDKPEIFTPGVFPEEIIGSGIPETTENGEKSDDSGESPDAASPVVPELIAPGGPREEPAVSDIPDTTNPEETPSDSFTPVTTDETLTDSGAQPASPVGENEPEIIAPVASPGVPVESFTTIDTTTPDQTAGGSRSGTTSPDNVPDEPEIITLMTSPGEPEGSFTTPGAGNPEKIPSDVGTQPASPDQLVAVPSTAGGDGTGRSETGIPEEGQPVEPAGLPEAERIPPAPGSPIPPGVSGNHRQKTFILAAAILILILGIAGFAVFSPAYFSAPAREIFPVPTPSLPVTPVPIPSTPVTAAPTPVVIPATGIWVRVTYPQDYYGRLGNPGSLREVGGSGDRLYQMNTGDRLVQVQMYKTDNSGNTLSVEIYRDGVSITHRTTSSPMGFIELLIDATTGAPPGITPRITQTPGPVQTNNQTSQISNTTIALSVNRTTPAPGQTTLPVNQITQVTNQTNNQTVNGTRVMYF